MLSLLKRGKNDIKRIDLGMSKSPRQRKGWKRFFLISKILVVLSMFIFTVIVAIRVSQWFDENRLVWRSPVLVQSPFYVEKRVEKLISPEVKVVGNKSEKKTKVFRLSELSLKARTNYVKHTFVGDKLLEAFDNDPKIIELISRESSLNMDAVNPESGACGLFQALPCEKMGCDLDDLDCQIEWGKNYIKNRYGSVENALKFHDEHNWY